MSRSWNLFLDDIIAACRFVDEFTRGMTQEGFLADPKTYWATIKMIEIIGEASRHIPEDARAQLPEVEWPNMIATRNVFAHRYFGIDEDILWDVVQTDIPELHDHIQQYLNRIVDVDTHQG
jgi:uncharacterized protein with HEPN domain